MAHVNWGFEYIRQFCVSEFMKKIKTQSAVCPRVGCSRRWGYPPAGAGALCTRCPPWNGRLYLQLSGTMSDESGVESPRHTWVRKSTQVSSACVLFCWQPIVLSIFPDTSSAMRGRGRTTEQGEEKEERERLRRRSDGEQCRSGRQRKVGALYSSQRLCREIDS